MLYLRRAVEAPRSRKAPRGEMTIRRIGIRLRGGKITIRRLRNKNSNKKKKNNKKNTEIRIR